jgi:hypothetical protein
MNQVVTVLGQDSVAGIEYLKCTWQVGDVIYEGWIQKQHVDLNVQITATPEG